MPLFAVAVRAPTCYTSRTECRQRGGRLEREGASDPRVRADRQGPDRGARSLGADDRREARLAYEMTLRNELSGGTPVVREFEQRWRALTDTRHAITTVNGTTALYSAYFGVGVAPDEVLCPDYTWDLHHLPGPLLGGAARVLRIGPAYHDGRPGRHPPQDHSPHQGDRGRAPVGLGLRYGRDHGDLPRDGHRRGGGLLSRPRGHVQGRPVGSIGRVGAWSLQGSKPVSAGEGVWWPPAIRRSLTGPAWWARSTVSPAWTSPRTSTATCSPSAPA